MVCWGAPKRWCGGSHLLGCRDSEEHWHSFSAEIPWKTTKTTGEGRM
jgi:hypothetical protein